MLLKCRRSIFRALSPLFRSSIFGQAAKSEMHTVEELLDLIGELNQKTKLFPDVESESILRFELLMIPRHFCLLSSENVVDKKSPKETRRAMRGGNANKAVAQQTQPRTKLDTRRAHPCDSGDSDENDFKMRSKKRKLGLDSNNLMTPRVRVCPKQHILQSVSGLPETYIGRHKYVYCDECRRKEIEKSSEPFWHCAQCEYDCCHSCAESKEFKVGVLYTRAKGNSVKRDKKDFSLGFRLISAEDFQSVAREISSRCGMLSESLTLQILAEKNAEIKKIKHTCEDDETGRLCEICFEDPVNVMLECTHSFCESCLDDWVASHGTCPMCRSQMDSKSKENGGIGWVLAAQEDKDLLQIGTESLEAIWSTLDRFDFIPMPVSTFFGGVATVISRCNYEEICRKRSVKRAQALFT